MAEVLLENPTLTEVEGAGIGIGTTVVGEFRNNLVPPPAPSLDGDPESAAVSSTVQCVRSGRTVGAPFRSLRDEIGRQLWL
jgi:hypothetical protein